jgi:hypothetical protein
MKGKTVLFVAAVCFFAGATGCTTVVPVGHVIVYKEPGGFAVGRPVMAFGGGMTKSSLALSSRINEDPDLTIESGGKK